MCRRDVSYMDLVGERLKIALMRLEQIQKGEETDPAFAAYFAQGAAWLIRLCALYGEVNERPITEPGPVWDGDGIRPVRALPPAKALDGPPPGTAMDGSEPRTTTDGPAQEMAMDHMCREPYTRLLSALFREIRSAIAFVYEADRERILIRMELFLEVHASFAISFRKGEGLPKADHLRAKIAGFIADYAQEEILRSTFGYPVRAETAQNDGPKACTAQAVTDKLVQMLTEDGWDHLGGRIIGIRCTSEGWETAAYLVQELDRRHMVPYFVPKASPLFDIGSEEMDLFMDETLCREMIRAAKTAFLGKAQMIRRYACVVQLTEEDRDHETDTGTGEEKSTKRCPDANARLRTKYLDAAKKQMRQIIGDKRCCISVLFPINYNCCVNVKEK